MNISVKSTAGAVSKKWSGRRSLRNQERSSGVSEDQQHIRVGSRQLIGVGFPPLWAMFNC